MMYNFVEVYALVKGSDIVGYRFYTYKDNKTEVFDVQTENTSLFTWCSGRLHLVRKGNLLMTEDELTGACKPTQLRDKEKFKELVHHVKFFKQHNQE